MHFKETSTCAKAKDVRDFGICGVIEIYGEGLNLKIVTVKDTCH